MNHCGYQQKNAMTGCEEMKVESVVCPKPRRLGLLSIDNHIKTFRPPFNNYQSDIEDSGVGAELLDIIRPKGSCYNPERFGGQVASSPPFFFGSPPSRTSNPVIKDEQFGNGNVNEQFGNGNVNVNFSPFSMAPPSPSSSARSCVRMKFSHTPAAVRVEGFDCLNMDRNNRSIYARA